jgi:DNA-binding GntR family transcriptional regulator
MAKRARFLTIPDIRLEKGSRVPLCKQLCEALRREIVNGRLLAGQRLPSSRVLANYLSASRNTVLEAFERLAAEGYLVGRVGSGTRVARPQPHTYLSELPRLKPITTKSFRQAVRESFYPAGTACLLDSEGNRIYLFSSQ